MPFQKCPKIDVHIYRALDKSEYLIINCENFSMKPYVVTPHLNRLTETVQIKGYNIWFNHN